MAKIASVLGVPAAVGALLSCSTIGTGKSQRQHRSIKCISCLSFSANSSGVVSSEESCGCVRNTICKTTNARVLCYSE